MNQSDDEPLILPLTDEETIMKTQIDPLNIDKKTEPMIDLPKDVVKKPDRKEIMRKARVAKDKKAIEKQVMDLQTQKELEKLREENNYFKQLAARLAEKPEPQSFSNPHALRDPFEKYSFTRKGSLI